MKRALSDTSLIQKYSEPMNGVFSLGDLQRLFPENNPVILHRRIKDQIEAGNLRRFSRGMYVAPTFSAEGLSARLVADSYVSLGTVLAKDLMVGSVPAHTVYAVKVGKGLSLKGPGLCLEYSGIKRSLFFGFHAEKGIQVATSEKALLDTLYLHLHGRSNSFDIYQDIDISRIDRATLLGWLAKYDNPRFVSFVKGYLDERR